MWGNWGYYLVGVGAIISCFGALNGWTLCLGQIPMAAARDEATRMLMICNPQNPTGRAYDADELQALARFVEAHFVNNLLQVLGVRCPQGHSPLPIIQPDADGDQLRNSPRELNAASRMFAH